ncbi:MAG: lytic murein transglycosylase, partial [Pseudomonadota bacterium]|nr:lytic murein transglycosylase [Pseudomonadota bacterium]
MAKYKIEINPLPKMTLLSLVILLIAFFQQNKALSNDFNDYSRWLNNVLIPKISKDLEGDFMKGMIKDMSLNRSQFEKLNQTKHAIRIKDFTFPESYFNETRLKTRAYYAKLLKNKHKLLLKQIEKKYRVPPDILLAIWAMESDFGRVKLKFLTLKTLAFQVYASH